jgi:hypothetical protein
VSIKIDGPSQIRTGSVRRPGRSEGTGGTAFSKLLTEETGSAAGAAAAGGVSAVDSLLALQEVEDATTRARRGRKRATDLLDKLDELRDGLLSGTLPEGKLHALRRLVQSRRDQIDDPQLAQILDEIDLRAQVELAKLSR